MLIVRVSVVVPEGATKVALAVALPASRAPPRNVLIPASWVRPSHATTNEPLLLTGKADSGGDCVTFTLRFPVPTAHW